VARRRRYVVLRQSVLDQEGLPKVPGANVEDPTNFEMMGTPSPEHPAYMSGRTTGFNQMGHALRKAGVHSDE
jgi:hypothetical protein